MQYQDNFEKKFGDVPDQVYVVLVIHAVACLLLLSLIKPPFVMNDRALSVERVLLITLVLTCMLYALRNTQLSYALILQGARHCVASFATQPIKL